MKLVLCPARLGCIVILLFGCTANLLANQAAAQKPPQTQSPNQLSAPQPSAAPPVSALTDTGWPRTVVSGATTITVFQPQVDTWDGFRLTGRAAVAVTEKAGAAPIYGIVYLSADAHIDKDDRLVMLEKFTITSAAFPGMGEKSREWAKILQARTTRLKPIALERFEATVAVSAAERKGESVAVKNDPPIVLISTVPSLLILVNGDPV